MSYGKIRFIVLGTVMISLLTTGCGGLKNTSEDPVEKPVPVKVEPVSTRNISKEYTYAVRTKPQEQVTVIPEASGKVEEVYFDIGDTVSKGDILFKIEQESVQKNIRDMEKQLENLELNIELQQLSLESAKDGQYRQQMLQLEQQLKSAQINYNTSKKSYQDIKVLHEKGLASSQQYDQAEAAFRQAEIVLDAAKESYDLYANQLSQTNVESKEKQLQQTRIQKEQLQLSLENFYDMLEDTSVKSPITGVVASRDVEKNQMASMQMASFTIIQADTLLIDVGVSENVIGQIHTGDRVAVFVSSFSEEPVPGEITAIAPAADERTSTYLVKIRIENQQNRIKPGMFAEVRFAVDRRDGVVVVPIQSVLFDSGGQYVYVVSQEDTAQKVTVKTGIDNGTHIEITEGLSVGDFLIVEGQNYIKENAKVNIIEKLQLEGQE